MINGQEKKKGVDKKGKGQRQREWRRISVRKKIAALLYSASLCVMGGFDLPCIPLAYKTAMDYFPK